MEIKKTFSIFVIIGCILLFLWFIYSNFKSYKGEEKREGNSLKKKFGSNSETESTFKWKKFQKIGRERIKIPSFGFDMNFDHTAADFSYPSNFFKDSSFSTNNFSTKESMSENEKPKEIPSHYIFHDFESTILFLTNLQFKSIEVNEFLVNLLSVYEKEHKYLTKEASTVLESCFILAEDSSFIKFEYVKLIELQELIKNNQNSMENIDLYLKEVQSYSDLRNIASKLLVKIIDLFSLSSKKIEISVCIDILKLIQEKNIDEKITFDDKSKIINKIKNRLERYFKESYGNMSDYYKKLFFFVNEIRFLFSRFKYITNNLKELSDNCISKDIINGKSKLFYYYYYNQCFVLESLFIKLDDSL